MPGQAPEILYRDGHLLAVNKPAGVMVHRSRLERTERGSLVQTLRRHTGMPIYPVHRLDRPTSGVLLFALRPDAARTLAQHFARKQIGKVYAAIVRGWTDPEGRVDIPLAPDAYADRSLQTPKPARTDYRRLATIELPHPVGPYESCRYALAEIRPATGRTHQIRRHMRFISHPVVGDTTYGDGKHNRFFRSHMECRRMMLSAVEISFPHPADGRQTTVTAPLDEAFRGVLERFGWIEAVPDRWLPA